LESLFIGNTAKVLLEDSACFRLYTLALRN